MGWPKVSATSRKNSHWQVAWDSSLNSPALSNWLYEPAWACRYAGIPFPTRLRDYPYRTVLICLSVQTYQARQLPRLPTYKPQPAFPNWYPELPESFAPAIPISIFQCRTDHHTSGVPGRVEPKPPDVPPFLQLRN